MPTTIYDSSLITQRRRDKAISGSFINRIQNPINPKTGSASLLGISQQSIINTVKNGQMTTYRKNDGGCTTENIGCPCLSIPVSNPLYQFFESGWVTNIGGTSDDISAGIIVDSSGNVYITGTYNSSFITINNVSSVSGGIINTTPYGTLVNAGNNDIFIVKYNTNGIAQWATNIGGTGVDNSSKISVDLSGNVYVTGSYSNSPITISSFNSVSSGTIITTTYGTLQNFNFDFDAFIVKYNTNGIAQWATNIIGNINDISSGISVDSSANVYVTGNYSSPTSINSFNSVSGGIINTALYGTLTNSAMFDSDIFIVKYNTNGIVQWATSITGTGFDASTGMSVDSSGNLYISGFYTASPLTINNFSSVSGGIINIMPYGTLVNAGNYDVFIVKYNTNGIAQWATNIGGTGNDNSSIISVDSSGNLYVSGSYNSSPLTINSFNSVSGGIINTTLYGTLSNTANSDVCIVKYNTNGIAQWATNIGGTDSDNSGGISVDSSGNLYVSGSYDSTPLTINSFNSVSGGIINTILYGTLVNTANYDIFIVKYNTNGIAQWATNIGGTGFDASTGMSVDSSGNLYISGIYAASPLTINNFSSVSSGIINTTLYGTLANTGSYDTFIAKYNTNGQIVSI